MPTTDAVWQYSKVICVHGQTRFYRSASYQRNVSFSLAVVIFSERYVLSSD